MNNFEFNKIAGAVLTSLLLIVVVHMIGNTIFDPEPLGEPAFVIQLPNEETAGLTIQEEVPPIDVLLISANIEAGRKIARKCMSCHTFDQGGKNKVGPNLWNILGAEKAQVGGFSYSSAMSEVSGVWSYTALDTFLANPRATIKGTKMTFIGLKKPHDRANLIGYLRILSDSPLTLPTAE